MPAHRCRAHDDNGVDNDNVDDDDTNNNDNDNDLNEFAAQRDAVVFAFVSLLQSPIVGQARVARRSTVGVGVVAAVN